MTFSGPARFDAAVFGGFARFYGVTFRDWGTTSFRGARFRGDARFDEATFSAVTTFHGATFSGGPRQRKLPSVGKPHGAPGPH